MTELHLVDAVDFANLMTAVVGNFVATLKRFGRSHLLVVEQAGATAPLRHCASAGRQAAAVSSRPGPGQRLADEEALAGPLH